MSIGDDSSPTVGKHTLTEEELDNLLQVSEYWAKSETLQAKARGDYLLKATELEFYMDELIAHHFCRDEILQNQLCELLLRRINFRPKNDIFDKILESYTFEPLAELKRLLPDLGDIIKFRNKLAHSAPSVDTKIMRKPFDEKFHLRSYENGKIVTITITKQELEEKLNKVRSAVSIVYAMDYFIQQARQKSS